MPLNTQNNQKRVVKRTRISKACDYCHANKIKCDGSSQCRNCMTHDVTCKYSESQRQATLSGRVMKKKVKKPQMLTLPMALPCSRTPPPPKPLVHTPELGLTTEERLQHRVHDLQLTIDTLRKELHEKESLIREFESTYSASSTAAYSVGTRSPITNSLFENNNLLYDLKPIDTENLRYDSITSTTTAAPGLSSSLVPPPPTSFNDELEIFGCPQQQYAFAGTQATTGAVGNLFGSVDTLGYNFY